MLFTPRHCHYQGGVALIGIDDLVFLVIMRPSRVGSDVTW